MKIKSISEIKVTKKTPNGAEYGFVITGDNVNIQLMSASVTNYGKHNEPLFRWTYSPYQVLVNDVEISIDGEFEDKAKDRSLLGVLRNNGDLNDVKE